MELNFSLFRNKIEQRFAILAAHGELHRTAAPKDGLWETYLSSFPEGSNPIFRERTVHDGSYDKGFIRAVGNVVAIDGTEVHSLWNIDIPEEPAYQAVADAMDAYVRAFPIDKIFLHKEPHAGHGSNFGVVNDEPYRFEHFHVNLQRNSGPSYYAPGPIIGPKLSDARASHDVMLRSLQEFKLEDVDTVLDLIAQNSLYRGDEHKATLGKFKLLKVAFDSLDPAKQDIFAWHAASKSPGPVARIRNTSIGQLLVDLSEGMDLDGAVRRFEAMVAPSNYKRPTALVTPKMVAAAKETVQALGLSLERRYARLDDISVNDILFADRSARPVMKDNVFDGLANKGTKPRNLHGVEEIGITAFITGVLPQVESIEVLFENRHQNNLVSLIAPVDPNAAPLFKWDNNFSWSYNGDMADSMKERVKKAGGSVSGDLLCRLAWDYTDDLDFHMKEPNGYEIYYHNARSLSASGGMLDVDANGMDGMRDEPVENIFYASKTRMQEGVYVLQVHNYYRRSDGKTFDVEIEFDGQVHSIHFDRALRNGERVEVAQISYSRAKGFEIIKSLPLSTASKEVWGVKTQDFRKVNLVALSPNYWGERGTGNKHYFFMLDGCQNSGEARGFYNEFLRDELSPHRKVIEMVGAKMKAEADPHQLSGLGFSSTQHNDLLVRVQGSFSRTLKIVF